MGGVSKALKFVDPITGTHQLYKEAKGMMKAPQAPEETARETKPTVVEDNSRAVEQERLRQQRKRGRASTVLAGDYRSGAAKRLLGE